jgi:hypothetical protein
MSIISAEAGTHKPAISIGAPVPASGRCLTSHPLCNRELNFHATYFASVTKTTYQKMDKINVALPPILTYPSKIQSRMDRYQQPLI